MSPDPLRCLEFKRSFHPVGIWGQAINPREAKLVGLAKKAGDMEYIIIILIVAVAIFGTWAMLDG